MSTTQETTATAFPALCRQMAGALREGPITIDWLVNHFNQALGVLECTAIDRTVYQTAKATLLLLFEQLQKDSSPGERNGAASDLVRIANKVEGRARV
jgi:hypothetical protein